MPGQKEMEAACVCGGSACIGMRLRNNKYGYGEKFASAIEQIVGERRILQIDSGNENKVLENEKEERAYQEIRESFGIDAVRLVEKKAWNSSG